MQGKVTIAISSANKYWANATHFERKTQTQTQFMHTNTNTKVNRKTHTLTQTYSGRVVNEGNC